MKFPLRYKPSRYAHVFINRLAWKLYPKHEDHENWLWRLNNWVSKPSVDYYIKQKTGKTREEWESES